MMSHHAKPASRRILWPVGFALLLSLTVTAHAYPSQILVESLAGRDSFARYCAPCHGITGKGNGSVAPALKTTPADLSRLAQRNDGAFPAERIRAQLQGVVRPLPAHGTSDMPIWGPIFRYFESDLRVQERIGNLIVYIEHLQEPSTGRDDPGARLFVTYCASCHGRDARGHGPVAGQLRHPPPDLIKFTSRNDGLFPSERVRQIIDGRGIAAHGDREMPVWGDAFQASDRLAPGDVEARIEAIMRYLAAIQERAGDRTPSSSR